MRAWWTAALCGLALSAGVAEAGVDLRPEGKAVVPRSQSYLVRSQISGRTFRIQVSEPVRPLRPGERAAIVYVLDGNYAFGMATDVARNLQMVGEMGPAYIVGVGYPSEDQDPWDEGREYDYIRFATDVKHNGKPIGGGGEAFERFLIDELRPALEPGLPVDPARSVLAGHSLGGLLAVNVMLDRPEAFSGYSVGSPALWVQPGLAEAVGAARARGAGRRVFIGTEGAGDAPAMIAATEDLAARLQAPGSAFVVTQRKYAGETHVSVEGVLLADALKTLVPPAPRPARGG